MADEVQNKVIAGFTVDLTGLKQNLVDLNDQVQKLQSSFATKSNDTFIADSTGAVRNLQQAIREMQLQAKEGEISLTQLAAGLNGLKATYAEALNPASNPMGAAKNSFDLRSALQKAQSDLSSFQDFELTSERRVAIQNADIQAENAKNIAQTKMAADKEYTSFWSNTLKEQETQQDTSINNQMRQIKTFYDLKLTSATQSLADLERLMNEETTYFMENQDKRMQALKLSYSLEKDMAAQQNASSKWSAVGSGVGGGSSFGMFDMGKLMVEFAGLNEVMTNLQKGFVDIDKGAAGLKQVFSENAQTQAQLNQVTSQFIGIAKEYGVANMEVIDAGKLWGRQYKDVETAITLTRNATILATVDNLTMADSNRAVEATMNAMNMKVTDSASAYASSMKIVDSWSALAHEASVSANDLAQGVERSAGAAYQANLSLDQLNALVAVGVRNTGLEGANVGNAIKTIVTNISVASPKVQNAFEQLGISMTTVGANGVKSMKPVWELITELSAAAKTSTTADAEWFKTISGGVMQVSKLEAILRDTDQITKVYNESLNSNGKAQALVQDQLHTVVAELNRLSDTIQQMAHDAESNGLGDVFKVIIVGITDLINGLSEMPKWVDVGAASLLGIAVAARVFSGVVSGLGTITSNLQLVWNAGLAIKEKSITMFGQETVATTTSTAALAAKTAVTEAAAVADGEQAAAAGVASVALEAETVAATEATAAFTTLDIVTGGIAIVIGLAVAALGISAIAMGANKTKTDALAVSTKDLNNQMAQTALAAQSSGTQLVQNVNNLQDIKQAFDNASKAMADSKVGTEEHTKAEAAMSEAKRELIGLVGEEQANQIIASANIVEAINTEITTKIKLQMIDEQRTIDNLTQEQTQTQTAITETEKRIKIYQDYADKQKAIADGIRAQEMQVDVYQPGGLDIFNAFGKEAGKYDSSAKDNLAAGASDANKKSDLQKQADEQTKTIQVLKDQMAQNKLMLEKLSADPNAKFGDLAPASTTPPKGSAYGSSAFSAVDTTDKKAKALVDSATSLIDLYSAQRGASGSTIDDTATKVELYTNKQNKLHEANDILRGSLASLEGQQASYNDQLASGKLKVDDYNKVSGEITTRVDSLTKEIDANSIAWLNQQKAIKDAQAQQLQSTYDFSSKWIQHQKAMGDLSAQQEYEALLRMQARYKEGTDLRIKLDEQVYAAKKALMSEEKKNLDDMVKNEKTLLETAKQNELDAIDVAKTAFDNAQDDKINKIDDQIKAQDQANTNADYATTLAEKQARRTVLNSAVGPSGIKEREALDKEIAKMQLDHTRVLNKQDLEAQKQSLTDEKTAKDKAFAQQKKDVEENYADLLKSFDKFKDDAAGRAELLKNLQITKDQEKNTTILANLDTFIGKYQAKMATISNLSQTQAQIDLQKYNSNFDAYNNGDAAAKAAAHTENDALRLKYGITENTGKLQHFDVGGTVKGRRGEAVPVIAHAGEMYINESQQSNLFKLLNFSMPQMKFSMSSFDMGKSSNTQVTNYWTISSGDVNLHDDADIQTYFNERNDFVTRTQAVAGRKQR